MSTPPITPANNITSTPIQEQGWKNPIAGNDERALNLIRSLQKKPPKDHTSQKVLKKRSAKPQKPPLQNPLLQPSDIYRSNNNAANIRIPSEYSIGDLDLDPSPLNNNNNLALSNQNTINPSPIKVKVEEDIDSEDEDGDIPLEAKGSNDNLIPNYSSNSSRPPRPSNPPKKTNAPAYSGITYCFVKVIASGCLGCAVAKISETNVKWTAACFAITTFATQVWSKVTNAHHAKDPEEAWTLEKYGQPTICTTSFVAMYFFDLIGARGALVLTALTTFMFIGQYNSKDK